MAMLEVAAIIAMIVIGLAVVIELALVTLALYALIKTVRLAVEQIKPVSEEVRRVAGNVNDLTEIARTSARRVDFTVDYVSKNVVEGVDNLSAAGEKINHLLDLEKSQIMVFATAVFEFFSLLIDYLAEKEQSGEVKVDEESDPPENEKEQNDE